VVERSASGLVATVDRFHAFVVDQQRADGGDEW
jgi:hypothetical protein